MESYPKWVPDKHGVHQEFKQAPDGSWEESSCGLEDEWIEDGKADFGFLFVLVFVYFSLLTCRAFNLLLFCNITPLIFLYPCQGLAPFAFAMFRWIRFYLHASLHQMCRLKLACTDTFAPELLDWPNAINVDLDLLPVFWDLHVIGRQVNPRMSGLLLSWLLAFINELMIE